MRLTPRLATFPSLQKSSFAMAVLALLSSSRGFSVDLYWGSGGVTGTWVTAGNWFTDASESTASETAPTLADDVFFNTTPDNALGGTVTVGANVAADSITFNTSGGTLVAQSGNRTLTLGGGGITVNSGAGNSTIGVSTNSLSVQTNASQTWANHSSSILNVRSLRASDTASGPVAVTLNAASSGNINFSLGIQDSADASKALSIIVDSAGTGSVNLVGSTYTGGTTLKRGVLSTNGSLGTGDIIMSAVGGTVDTRLNTSGIVNNNITVQTGTGLRALTGSGSGDFRGNIYLNNDISIGSISSSSQTLAVSGIISGSNHVTVGRIATGTNNPTVTLSGASTYTGKTTIESATLVVQSLNRVAGGSASSSLGAPTTVENGTISMSSVSASTLRYVGTTGSTDRVIDVVSNSGATLEQAGTGSLTLEGNITMSGTGSRTLTLRGATAGTAEISGVIQNIGGGFSTSVTKIDSGTWKLSGLNVYSGTTSISGGSLEVSKLANGGVASSIGLSSNTTDRLVFGGSSAATLRYVGSGDSTDRRFSIGGAGAMFDASGTAALKWTNTAAPNYVSAGQARTVTFKGTNIDDNTMSATFGDSGIGQTTIVKDGVGKWIFTGNNTYTGTTTVNGGKLSIAIGGSLASGSAVSVTSGELNVNGTVGGTVAVSSEATLSGSGTIGGEVNVSTGGFLSPGNSPGNLTLNNGLTLSGSYSWDLSALSTANAGTEDSPPATVSISVTPVNDAPVALAQSTSTAEDTVKAITLGAPDVPTLHEAGLTGFDIITISGGSVDLTGATLGLNLGAFTPSADAFWQTSQTWNGILNNTGIGTRTGMFAAIDNSSWSSLGTFNTTYTDNDVNLVWTVVPEPGTALLAGSFGMIALLRRRRLA